MCSWFKPNNLWLELGMAHFTPVLQKGFRRVWGVLPAFVRITVKNHVEEALPFLSLNRVNTENFRARLLCYLACLFFRVAKVYTAISKFITRLDICFHDIAISFWLNDVTFCIKLEYPHTWTLLFFDGLTKRWNESFWQIIHIEKSMISYFFHYYILLKI